MASATRNIGINVKVPDKRCDPVDPNCPFHGTIRLRGRIFEGQVVSTRMNKTAVIRRDYLYLVKKYDRYERRKGVISAHVPDCLDIKEGDIVRAMECRPLSKSKSFVVIEKKEIEE
ncbi:MAG: 30S ribosomal protein S17 [Methanobacteriota archaeon]|nr:MAG: 30S ribosomal protein S17 [Euryarchaeota archaeon]